MSNEPRGAGVAEPPAVAEGGRVRARPAGGDGRDGAGAQPAAQRKPGPPHSVLREYFESLVVTAVMALFGMTFVVQAVKVPTGSMQNTINIGDHLLVNKFIFAPGPVMPFLPQREIQRGDIIVFKYPGKYQGDPRFAESGVDDTAPNNLPYKTNYVKRVIGLPGDRVEVRDTLVFINGQPLEEQVIPAHQPPPNNPDTPENENDAPLTDESGAPLTAPAPAEGSYSVYVEPRAHPPSRRTTEGEKFDVPEGHYFVMGDNRDNSEDSRYWGYVPRELVVGRAMFVYWSYDESLPTNGNFLFDFFLNTRWGRTGTLVK